MKTEIKIIIETNNKIGILPEDSKSDDYTKEQLDKFRNDYSKNLHNKLINTITKYFEEGGEFEEYFIDGIEENYIEDFDSFKDYGINININVVRAENEMGNN